MSDRDLFANFERMRREMDELFGDVFERTRMGRRRIGFTPPTDVAYTSDPPAAVVTLEVAGVTADTIEIKVQARQLLIAGERNPGSIPAADYQQVEIERGRFRRVVTLVADPRPDQIKATYEDGMLTVEVPLQIRQPRRRTVPMKDGGER
jgi:HSP20 family protein